MIWGWHEEDKMHTVITKHFNEVFATPTQRGKSDFLEPLIGQISEEINTNLTKDFTPK